jgi:hypothetical protein
MNPPISVSYTVGNLKLCQMYPNEKKIPFFMGPMESFRPMDPSMSPHIDILDSYRARHSRDSHGETILLICRFEKELLHQRSSFVRAPVTSVELIFL